MTREEKVAKARELRGKGWTLKQIALRFETSITTARRWAHPDSYERDKTRSREWKSRNKRYLKEYDKGYAEFKRRECGRCGGLLHHRSSSGVCFACREEKAHSRALQISEWWAAGLSMAEICSRLDWSIGHLGIEMDRLRAKGYELPYRYRSGKRRGRKFPRQVPA